MTQTRPTVPGFTRYRLIHAPPRALCARAWRTHWEALCALRLARKDAAREAEEDFKEDPIQLEGVDRELEVGDVFYDRDIMPANPADRVTGAEYGVPWQRKRDYQRVCDEAEDFVLPEPPAPELPQWRHVKLYQFKSTDEDDARDYLYDWCVVNSDFLEPIAYEHKGKGRRVVDSIGKRDAWFRQHCQSWSQMQALYDAIFDHLAT